MPPTTAMRRASVDTGARVAERVVTLSRGARHAWGVLPPSVQAFVAISPIQRAPIARAVVDAAAALPAGARVLDAGSGEAPYRSLFGHCEYLTQDWPGTPHQGAHASDVIADLHDLPLEDASFDAVVCTEVLEHVAEPQRVLAELRRILRPGGRLLVTVPFAIELHEEPHDHYRYTSHGLRGLLERAGFVDVEVVPATGWFSTFAQIMRHQRASTSPDCGNGSNGPVGRLVGALFLLASEALRRVAPTLDRRLDRRHALPLGWIARARRGA